MGRVVSTSVCCFAIKQRKFVHFLPYDWGEGLSGTIGVHHLRQTLIYSKNSILFILHARGVGAFMSVSARLESEKYSPLSGW